MKTVKFLSIVLFLCTIGACKADAKKEVFLAQYTPSANVENYQIKVALLLDTSNSMDGLIDQAKSQLWEIVNELSYAKCENSRPDLQIALYEYGNDNLSERTGYLRKILGFTEDLDDVSKELFSLTTNGGSEFCGTVIRASLDQLDWGNNADDLKMIFIAGNEPFTQGKINYKDAGLQAKEKDIVVNTIFCGKYEHGVETKWKDGAQITYGDYIAIDHNKETVHIASPYDDIILQLNIRLNNTYIPYGSQGRKKVAMQQEQDENAAEYSKANAVSRTVSKGSHLYKNSTWDLVDAEKEAGFSYSKLKDEELPTELRGKSESQIKAYVEYMRKERETIQSEIAQQNLKRRNFIQNKKNTESKNLENAMIQALKKQAKRKNYIWD
ncbi:hypothetical protein ACFQO1_09825 [Jejudonia soesokkakensis]|uniref:VWFA domain-containing protein n=1 Tax=Jejudonia soesokkakensis TaxID=1323432 RepID=A0ABW2MW67_9FLAO